MKYYVRINGKIIKKNHKFSDTTRRRKILRNIAPKNRYNANYTKIDVST